MQINRTNCIINDDDMFDAYKIKAILESIDKYLKDTNGQVCGAYLSLWILENCIIKEPKAEG